MKNEIIVVLIIVLLIVGGVVYFYKDAIGHKYNKTSGKVKDDVSHAVKKIKEDLK